MAHHHFTRNDWIRVGVVVAVVAAALYFVFPFWPLDKVVQLGLDLQGGVRMILEPTGTINGVEYDELSEEGKITALNQVISVLDNRVDQYGVVNPEIRVFGGDRILVNLPGTTNTESARSLIGQTAMLEFRRVLQVGEDALDELIPTSSSQELFHNDERIPFLVDSEVLLTGAALAGAKVETQTSLQAAGRYQVRLEFSPEGAQAFE